jgi:hypothetical protein
MSIKTEIPRNLHQWKLKVGLSFLIIKSKLMLSSLYDENRRRNNEPLYDKHLLLEFSVCLMKYGIILCGGNNESNNIFLNCKRRPFE